MTPDAKLRMEIYQEGQRAYSAGTACPYTDWRAGTWAKGRKAAEEWHADVSAEDRGPLPQARALRERIADLVYAAGGRDALRVDADQCADEIIDLIKRNPGVL